jgi:hypothetical protein
MKNKALHIGLHAQTLRNADGTIAGSEITTAGLERAFLNHPLVSTVHRFAPDKLEGLEDLNLDLLIIEGWHPSLNGLIQRVRSSDPTTMILFWNLSFFGFNEVVKLDVDAFLSNSRKVASLLSKVKPTEFVMLAADTDIFRALKPLPEYQHQVAYLGMNHLHKSANVTDRILLEAASFNLAIYGTGWHNHASLSRHWKGKLPLNAIPDLYSSATIVLGTTEDRQRQAGMINNRVFEALACGAFFISEHSHELENTFGDSIFYSYGPGDTHEHIQAILDRPEQFEHRKQRAIELIRSQHDYRNRVTQILDFYASL